MTKQELEFEMDQEAKRLKNLCELAVEKGIKFSFNFHFTVQDGSENESRVREIGYTNCGEAVFVSHVFSILNQFRNRYDRFDEFLDYLIQNNFKKICEKVNVDH